MNMNVENGAGRLNRGRGCPKKEDVKKFRHMIRLNDKENRRFLAMYRQSGFKSKSRFIAEKVLNHQLKIIEINKSAIDFVMLLSQLFVQYRGVKNNYNRLFSALVNHLGEEKARKLLKIVENPTLDFIQTMKEIEQITTKLRNELYMNR